MSGGDGATTAGYLRRLGVDAQTGPPSLELLAALQLAHLVRVPFENLDVYHRRGVRTDVAWSLPKVVDRGRGGWCFELNGAFAWLLGRLGFAVDLVESQVWEPPAGPWGPAFDHLTLVVHLGGQRFLVDVGFGDCCLRPLLLGGGEVAAVPRRARVELDAHGVTLTELVPGEAAAGRWEPQVRATLVPRRLEDFDARSRYLQTEPGLSWSEKPFATRALDATGSRVTLRAGVLKRRDGVGEAVEVPVEPDQWSAVLREHFGLEDALRPAGPG